MKKIKSIASIIGIVLIGIIYILITKVFATETHTASGLYKTSTLLCIQRGTQLKGNVTYTISDTVEIKGLNAEKGSKTVTSKSNAKMALICYYASKGGYSGSIDDAGTNYSIESNGRYRNSYSQNAIWDYWRTWYKYVGKELPINTVFAKSGDGAYNSKSANYLLNKGNDYYDALKGYDSISVSKTSDCTKEVSAMQVDIDGDNDKETVYYIGPFVIKKPSNEFIGNTYLKTTDKVLSYSYKDDNNKFKKDHRYGSGTAIEYGRAFYVRISSALSDTYSNIDIDFNYKVDYYTATVKCLKSTSTSTHYQNLLKVSGSKDITTLTERYTWKNYNYDFSLQKYIVQVGTGVNKSDNGELTFNNGTYNSSTRRSELAADTSSDEDICRRDNKAVTDDNNVYLANKPGGVSTTKRNEAVEIQRGNYVAYKIEVYNNNTEKSANVIVRDRINTKMGATFVGIYSGYKDGKYTGKLTSTTKADSDMEVGEYKKYYSDGDTTNGYERYSWRTPNIAANSHKSYWIVVRYNSMFTGKVENKAYIGTTKASDDYRTIDYDYVTMIKSNVSLQKYIIQVNGVDLNKNDCVATTNMENRVNKMANEESINEIANNVKSKGDYKEDTPVYIEAGDIVRYAIVVYNNGKEKETGIEVTDYIPDEATAYKWSDSNTWLTEKTATKTVSLAAGTSTTLYIDVKFDNYVPTIATNDIYESSVNTAEITDTDHENKTSYRVSDSDYIKMKPYKVSLQKIVYSVNGNSSGISSFDRWTSWESTANVNNSPTSETNNRDNRYAKHNNPVTVANGDTVTYAVRVRNDYDTKVKITQIIDQLPTGVTLKNVTNESGNSVSYNISGQTIKINEATRLLNKNETQTYYVEVEVTESNISTRLLRNYAYIDSLANRNDVTVEDSTGSNNDDADYIQLKDIVISGSVWNDKALDKKQDNYNGVYDEGKENKLSGIKVMLYRDGKGVISTTTTDDNGNYSFDASKIDSSVVTEQCERYIKAPYTCTSSYSGNVKHGSNYWKENNYYSYYIVFEYDGITYTSTVFADVTSNNSKDSNAKEDNGQSGKTRKTFNDSFSTINNQKGISYTTKNENGYIPQSNHVYNSSMAMKSSTNKITLSNSTELETQLTHVNLGLRGRDVFDLELTSDVYSTKITVNGQSGKYNYNSNKVTVRKADISVAEDSANFASESRTASVGEVKQSLRSTDIATGDKLKELTKSNYTSTNLGIEVTYKITVTNASQTQGAANKIINYYDNKYTFNGAYSSIGGTKLSCSEGTSGTGYKSIIITTQGTKLNQSDTMDLYVVYSLNDPSNTLKSLLDGSEKVIPTYNMAEIYEYKTFTTNNNEATRGLLDKDSAPGSVATEKVRLSSGTSNDTTVQYYFNKKLASNKNNVDYLKVLKYEDDTYATPTLYFTLNDEKPRTLTGTVFEDKTKVNSDRVKSGNGVKDEGEVGVYGATVELVEINNSGDPENVAQNAGKVRYRTTTREDGTYTFINFLPGKYIVRYYYGDSDKTIIKYMSDDKKVNATSYNGEDYQSTNNKYDVTEISVNKLNTTANYWYAYNEKNKVSTGTDNTSRRSTVSSNVTNFTDEQMTLLNNARDGKALSDAEEKILQDNTYMFATTPNFTLTVEKTETNSDNKDYKQKDQFTEYEVKNMNFGIAEVPVTTIDLQKHVDSFTVTESAGDKKIAEVVKQPDGKWEVKKGNVLAPENTKTIDVSIEDEKLQGARLEVTYKILARMSVIKNYDNVESIIPTIDGIADYVDNDLSYNENLGRNKEFWELSDYESLAKVYSLSQYKEGTVPTGTVDKEGIKHSTVLAAKANNPILLKGNGTGECTITLEKVLSSQEVTVEDIITSTISSYDYNNTVEILKLDYSNNKSEDGSITFRDRVRDVNRYIILAGTQHDSATSETITIHPPTGENNNVIYYIIAAGSLIIITAGVILIKKYAIKKD